METRFKILTIIEANNLAPDLVDYSPGYRDDYRLGVFEFNQYGKLIKEWGSDGGEPEDQTLNRDWNWVVTALNYAFDLGRKFGRSEEV